jgi:hypothetical protein
MDLSGVVSGAPIAGCSTRDRRRGARLTHILELLECAALLPGSIQPVIAFGGVLSPGVAADATVVSAGPLDSNDRLSGPGTLCSAAFKPPFTLDTVELISHSTSQNLHLRGSN